MDRPEQLEGFVTLVLQAGAQPQDRESVTQRQTMDKNADADPPTHVGSLVLIGGPGQGKSTLGQFICQLYRAAILKDRPQIYLSYDCSDAISYIIRKWKIEGHELPTARRFPVRVELKAFADELANEKCNSLLEYIAQKIDRRAAQSVRARTLSDG